MKEEWVVLSPNNVIVIDMLLLLYTFLIDVFVLFLSLTFLFM